MSEEREELIAYLRATAEDARQASTRYGPGHRGLESNEPIRDQFIARADRFTAWADSLAHQETSGWREPEGWRLVPVEPTAAMLSHVAGLDYLELSDAGKAAERAAYANMLAAAPSPPTSQETT